MNRINVLKGKQNLVKNLVNIGNLLTLGKRKTFRNLGNLRTFRNLGNLETLGNLEIQGVY